MNGKFGPSSSNTHLMFLERSCRKSCFSRNKNKLGELETEQILKRISDKERRKIKQKKIIRNVFTWNARVALKLVNAQLPPLIGHIFDYCCLHSAGFSPGLPPPGGGFNPLTFLAPLWAGSSSSSSDSSSISSSSMSSSRTKKTDDFTI